MNIKSARSFAIPALLAFLAVILVALLMGYFGAGNSAQAGDSMPSNINPHSVGQGGVDLSSVRQIAGTDEFEAWKALDLAGNICLLVSVNETRAAASYCAAESAVKDKGISRLLLAAPTENEASGTWLQTYLLPDGADVEFATENVPGSTAHGNLVVRLGSIEGERSRILSIPAGNRFVSLQVFGADVL